MILADGGISFSLYAKATAKCYHRSVCRFPLNRLNGLDLYSYMILMLSSGYRSCHLNLPNFTVQGEPVRRGRQSKH